MKNMMKRQIMNVEVNRATNNAQKMQTKWINEEL